MGIDSESREISVSSNKGGRTSSPTGLRRLCGRTVSGGPGATRNSTALPFASCWANKSWSTAPIHSRPPRSSTFDTTRSDPRFTILTLRVPLGYRTTSTSEEWVHSGSSKEIGHRHRSDSFSIAKKSGSDSFSTRRSRTPSTRCPSVRWANALCVRVATTNADNASCRHCRMREACDSIKRIDPLLRPVTPSAAPARTSPRAPVPDRGRLSSHPGWVRL